MSSERLVNVKTGEMYDGLAIPKKKYYPRDKDFMTMFRDGWEYLSEIDDLAGRDYRVLFRLLAKLDYENWIAIAHETLAQELHLDRANVTRSIKRLVKHRVIFVNTDPVDKRRHRYRLNADLGWKGDAVQWAVHQKERSDEKIIRMPTRTEMLHSTP